MQGDGDANILSTPNLMTLDNEEASIMVGQNVPFLTAPNTAGTSGSVNPFTTIERKDVGRCSRCVRRSTRTAPSRWPSTRRTRQSSRDGEAQSGATTTKRSIESNVLVDDGPSWCWAA
jgi:general secretion pathway protein D